ncbi:bifunctional diguanylate cyclase/phosphodiesterase [Blastococcus saxobsidens]|uniref:Bifunctional diguanylate cyclase/phosphodiesterase n=1 Tax=Blastococcus saxobsidens TaxID=138336 RepID=A0A6L9W8B8_9ACTN|nr:bifunctional diguanylate cyclase/phosphodiesterase [Blastococcus saxobsidens]
MTREARAHQRGGDRSLRAVRVLGAVSGGAWVLASIASAAGVGTVASLLAEKGKLVFLASLVVMFAVRGAAGAGRAAWWCFAGAVACYLAGAAAYEFHYRHVAVVPQPSWSDAAFMGFYPLAFVGLLLLIRRRTRRLPLSTWLDCAVTGLTAAAVAAAVALGALMQEAGRDLALIASMGYAAADLFLFGLIAGGLVLIGRDASPGWWWMTGGLAMFVVADTAYAYQVVHGTYVVGGPLDTLWGLAFIGLGLGACVAPRPVRLDTAVAAQRPLVVPAACALVALGILFQGYLADGDPVAGSLAMGAVLAALARTGLTFRDVRALADSLKQARTDELTGLPNRRSVFEAFDSADERLADGTTIAVLVLDLDRFKEINDSLGHSIGDALLVEVGGRLRERLRSADLLARLGGDEFVVLAEDLDAAAAMALGHRLREQFLRPFVFDGVELGVDVSIGIAVGPGDSTSTAELLQLADLAMYAAKGGRQGVSVFDEDRDGHGRHRLEDVAQLRRALDRHELVLHYQPKLALSTGEIDGVEALVRWQHPTRGLLYPDTFIDLAESAGLMSRLTTQVIDMALAQSRAWADEGRELTMAVNVSPSNLVDEQFPDHVAALLRDHGRSARSLVLEVTESLLMEDRERAVRVLGRLRDDGVGVAIDDYGTGHSSLAYLAALPVTELKLDRTFVSAMTGSARAESIVTSTLQLAHALGLVLVAEGAEDQATVDALTSLGCDLVQGYHLSRPLPPEQLWLWLEERAGTTVG